MEENNKALKKYKASKPTNDRGSCDIMFFLSLGLKKDSISMLLVTRSQPKNCGLVLRI